MKIEKVYFEATDGLQLSGILHINEDLNNNESVKLNKEVVLSVHGMTSNCFKKREDIFAQVFTENKVDYFCFNNRGADIMSYFERIKDGKLVGRIEAGSSKEIFEDCYYDIKGAILMLLEKGYETIYLQGHSYGSAKSVYTYQKLKQENENKILSHIRAVSLLSIVDVPRMCQSLLGDNFVQARAYAKKLVEEGKEETLIPREYFLHPLSAKNFLFCSEIGGVIDLVPFGEKNPDFSALNSIECKIFMCWGKERDMISQAPEELEKIIRSNLKNSQLEIKFIEGTGHNYHYKEKETAEEMVKFIKGK